VPYADFKNEPFTDFSDPANQQAFAAAMTEIQATFGQDHPAWIGGEAIADRPSIESRDPGDLDRVIGRYAKCDAQDAERAVVSAHEAFQTWRFVAPAERVGYFTKAADLMRERKHLFSAMMVFEAGKSWAEADADTAECIDFMDYYARQALALADPPALTPVAGEQNHIRYIPLGVGAIIPPWNFPLAIMAGMSSAALITGNTVVLKPASATPGIAAMWVDLMFEVGLPKNVLNYCPGSGGTFGEVIVNHKLTRFISFTGSREVGLGIFQKSATTQDGQLWMKRLIAEMGGKDGMLIDAECDLDDAVDATLAAAFGFQGQKCSACSRAMIHADVYDEFVSKLIPKVEAITQGHQADLANFMGPVIDQGAKNKTLEYIEIGKSEGKLLTGGGEAPGNGYYVQPTVIGDVPPQARVSREEIFGPVLALIRVADFEHGLEVANNTDYGLTGAVYTDNDAHKAAAMDRFHVGNFYINRKCTGALVGAHPFGGFNMSGTDSKAGGPDYLLLFTQAKTISEKI
jgi:1-pyrroline-5-carboxylate dehydrogenase